MPLRRKFITKLILIICASFVHNILAQKFCWGGEAVDMTTLTFLLITFSGQNKCKSFMHVVTIRKYGLSSLVPTCTKNWEVDYVSLIAKTNDT